MNFQLSYSAISCDSVYKKTMSIYLTLQAYMDLYIYNYDFKFQLLARQQAQREEELAQSQRHILALQVSFQVLWLVIFIFFLHFYSILLCQDEIEELERENQLHSQQVGNCTYIFKKNMIL